MGQKESVNVWELKRMADERLTKKIYRNLVEVFEIYLKFNFFCMTHGYDTLDEPHIGLNKQRFGK